MQYIVVPTAVWQRLHYAVESADLRDSACARICVVLDGRGAEIAALAREE